MKYHTVEFSTSTKPQSSEAHESLTAVHQGREYEPLDQPSTRYCRPSTQKITKVFIIVLALITAASGIAYGVNGDEWSRDIAIGSGVGAGVLLLLWTRLVPCADQDCSNFPHAYR